MALVYGLSKAPAQGWHSGTVWGFIGAAVALLALFIWNEKRSKQPLMPLAIFKNRNVSGGNGAFLVIACTMFAMFFFLTLYIQIVLGYTPIKTGLSFLPVTFIIAITSGIVAKLVGKIGYKPPMVAGPLVLACGLFILSNIMTVGGDYWHNVFPGLAVCAMGMGLTFVSGTLAATSGVPKHFSGLASGILNTAQQVGGALGLGILSAIAFTTITADLLTGVAPAAAQVHGFHDALRVGAVLALVAAAVVIIVVKNRKVDAKEAMSSAV
jgi:MFS family permease